jgi:hypothetical protein
MATLVTANDHDVADGVARHIAEENRRSHPSILTQEAV